MLSSPELAKAVTAHPHAGESTLLSETATEALFAGGAPQNALDPRPGRPS